MEEIILDDSIKYNVLFEKIEMFSFEDEENKNTVVYIDGIFYHMGNVPPNLETAINAFQEYYQTKLSKEEFDKVLKDN